MKDIARRLNKLDGGPYLSAREQRRRKIENMTIDEIHMRILDILRISCEGDACLTDPRYDENRRMIREREEQIRSFARRRKEPYSQKRFARLRGVWQSRGHDANDYVPPLIIEDEFDLWDFPNVMARRRAILARPDVIELLAEVDRGKAGSAPEPPSRL